MLSFRISEKKRCYVIENTHRSDFRSTSSSEVSLPVLSDCIAALFSEFAGPEFVSSDGPLCLVRCKSSSRKHGSRFTCKFNPGAVCLQWEAQMNYAASKHSAFWVENKQRPYCKIGGAGINKKKNVG